jgi:protein nanos 1
MSARSYSSKSASVAPAFKMCCKVCKDSGEEEAVYSSHRVKDYDGNVTCPKLRAIVCSRCHKKGHTQSYCKTDMSKVHAAKDRVVPASVAPVALGKPSRFAALWEPDSDSEKDNKLMTRKYTKPDTKQSRKVVAEPEPPKQQVFDFANDAVFPELPSNTKKPQETREISSSYAEMATKPAPAKPVRPVTVRPPSPLTEPIFSSRRASEMDWAAEESDSDSEYSVESDSW